VTADPILAVENLVAGYEPGLPIVRGASVEVRAGEIVVILGPNGAGKSTLVKAVAGLVPKISGRVVFAGEDIAARKAHQLVGLGLVFVPQTENVFAGMTIGDNLKLAAAVLTKPLRRERIEAVCAFFPDLGERRGLLAGRLSGGQRQMLAIARALLVGPKMLMLDEPSAGLSPKLVELVFARLRDIRASGVTILLVEQNARAALSIADRAYVLAEGRNRHVGPAAELRDDPAIWQLYIGAGASEAIGSSPALAGQGDRPRGSGLRPARGQVEGGGGGT
jgi:branched-chain amino acid transport system ATP-binding protein